MSERARRATGMWGTPFVSGTPLLTRMPHDRTPQAFFLPSHFQKLETQRQSRHRQAELLAAA